MSKKFIVLGMVFALTGCIQGFTPPVAGSFALLSERDSATASVAVYGDAIECKRPRALYPLFAMSKKRFVRIPANKPLTLRVTTYANLSTTPEFDNITFIPEAGQKYLVERHYSKNTRFSYRVQILKVLPGAEYIPVKYIQREDGFFRACTDTQMKENIKNIVGI